MQVLLDKTVYFAFSTDRRDSIGTAFAICIHVDGAVDTSDGMQEMVAFEVKCKGLILQGVRKIPPQLCQALASS